MKTATGLGLVLAWALGLTGCPATDVNPACSDVQVSFENPAKEGQEVTSPLKVSIEARTPDGVVYEFDTAALEVDGASVATGGLDGGSSLTFGRVLLAVGGPRTLTASVNGGPCTGKSAIPSRSVTITVVADAGVTDAGP